MKEFNQEFKSLIKSYQFTLDIDSKDNEKLIDLIPQIKKINSFFKYYKIKFQIRCSGRGFHVVCEEIKTDENKIEKLMEIFQFLAEYLKNYLDLNNLDLSIYDYRRIWKCPFTIDFKSGNLCLPLFEKEIENFDEKILNPWNYINKPMLEVDYEFNKRNEINNGGENEGFINMIEDLLEEDLDIKGVLL